MDIEKIVPREKGKKPVVVVGLPAFNERKYVGSLVLCARRYADQVFLLDDGSTDDTAEIARLAGATVITHEANLGKGAAIQTLFKEMVKNQDADVFVLMDADSQHNPDEIPNLVEPIVAGHDMVIGTRARSRRNIPLYRRLGQNILLRSTRLASPRSIITDSESGYRAFSRKALAAFTLEQNGFAIESEMIVQATEKNLSIAEVPISVNYTTDGSTLNPLHHGLVVLAQIIGMISERRPLSFFGIIGLVFMLIGLIAGIMALTTFATAGDIPIGTAMVAVLFIIIGTLSGFSGIILYSLSKKH